MSMPLVAPLFIGDQDRSSILTMVNELTKTVHATVVARRSDGSALAEQVLTFAPHSQRTLSLRELLKPTGLVQAIGSIQVVPDPMEVQTMAIAAQLSITDSRRSPPTYLEEELLAPDPKEAADYRIVVPSGSGRPVVALLSTTAEPQVIALRCLQSDGASMHDIVHLAAEQLVLIPACSSSREDRTSDAETTFRSLETGHTNTKAQTVAIEARSTRGMATFAAWGVGTIGSSGTRTSMALNFLNCAAMKSPSIVFAGVPVGVTDRLGGEPFKPELAVANLFLYRTAQHLSSSIKRAR